MDIIVGPKPHVYAHVVCHDCRKRHAIWTSDKWKIQNEVFNFSGRHFGHHVELRYREPEHGQIRRTLALRVRKAILDAVFGGEWAHLLEAYAENATISANVSDSQAVTITLSSVTNTSFAVATAITSNTFISALIQFKIKCGTSPSANGYFNVYVSRSADGGTTYDDAATKKPSGLPFLGSMPCGSAPATGDVEIGTFDTQLVGILGTHFKPVAENQSGVTTDTTAGNHSCVYSGVDYTSA